MGFGDDIFGPEGFGEVDWGRKAIWENVPQRHRDLDVSQYLEKLLQVFQDELDVMRKKIADLPIQREPYEARGTVDEGETFYIAATERITDEVYGGTLKFTGAIADLPSGYSPIEKVGPGWIMQYGDVTYKVVLVQTRNYDDTPNEIWVSGSGEIFSFEVEAENVGVGDGTASPTVTLADAPIKVTSNPSTDITTAGFEMTIDLAIAGLTTIYDNGSGELREDSGGFATGTQHGTIDYDTGIVTLAISGDTADAGEIMYATYTIDGFLKTFYPPSMLNYLARDFGFENDLNDPEPIQRSAIANVTKYLGLKSTQDSYRIRGEISGFDVVAMGLYRMSNATEWNALPSNHTYQVGSVMYTDLAPRKVLFDDISADVQFYDPDTAAWVSLVDDELMYENTSPDGMSIGLAFGINVTSAGLQVLSSVALTDAEKITYGIPNGYKVTVSMTTAEHAIFNIRRGVFGLTPGYPSSLSDTVYWIDEEVSFAVGVWTIIMAGANSIVDDAEFPGVGVDPNCALRYWPEVVTDCTWCRSSKMNMEITPTDTAVESYGSGVGMSRAISALITKIESILVPIHVNVLEYIVNTNIAIEVFGTGEPPVAIVPVTTLTVILTGVTLGATVNSIQSNGDFDGATAISLDIDLRGDLNDIGENMDCILDNGVDTPTTVFSGQTGFSDATWRNVVSGYDALSILLDKDPITVRGVATATVGAIPDGQQRWIFTITKA